MNPIVNNIRTRLTLRYTLVVALLMFFYSGLNLLFQYFYLSDQIDLTLKEDLEIVQDILVSNEKISSPFRLIPDHHPKPYERYVEIWTVNGVSLYHSSAFTEEMLPPPPNPDRYSSEPRIFTFQFPSGERWRTIGALVTTASERRIVRISMSEAHLFGQMLDIFGFMSLVTPLFLIAAVATGYFLARKTLKPIDTMVAQAKKIDAENLHERLTVLNPDDELGNLATVTNGLLDRIQQSFEQLRRFTTDASHELRTPLTAMRSVGEVGLQPGKKSEEYREVIGSMLEETGRLTHLVDCLLFLSKAESEKIKPAIEDFNLLDFLENIGDMLQVLAEEKSQSITARGDRELTIRADKSLLRRAVLNLIDNAIKYTPEHGSIHLTVFAPSSDRRCITVADTGPGIPETERAMIFERFYRLERDRSNGTDGVGIGLSIVQWIVRLHGGTITLDANVHGASFTINLPMAPV
jgi:heavy metal sensor kinase